MGCLFSSESSSDEDDAQWTPVVLNVYDLTPLNKYTYWCGVGIFHSGIEVHGLEYGFGAHDYPTSGVFEVEPRSCPGFIYRRSIKLGRINIPAQQVRILIEEMASEYHGDTYHLISKNCNHFTDDASLRLTGRSIPGWVNRLAWLGAACNCILPECLKLPAVKQQIPECHGISEDGSESFSVIVSNEHIESDDTDQDKHLLSPSGAGEVTTIKETHR